MAMEMLDYSGFAKMELDRDVQQAASAGLEGVLQRLMRLLSQQPQDEDFASIAGTAIAELRKTVSLLGRSGHARVRRGPRSPSSSTDSSFSESLMASCSSNGAASASDSDGGSANTLFRPQPKIAVVAVQIAKQLPWSNPSSLCSESAYASAIAAFSPSPTPAASTMPLGQAKREIEFDSRRLCSNPPKSLFATGFPINGGPAHAHSFTADTQSKVINGVLPKSALCRSDAALFAKPPQQFFLQNPNGAFERVVKPYPSPSPTQSMPARKMEVSTTSCPLFSAATTSFMSSLSLDGNGNQHALQSALISGGSGGRPPLAVIRKKCSGKSEDGGGKCSSSGKCHCSKRRSMPDKKSRNKTVKLVPAISSKMSDIPSDEYSWRKYGQKPIKGSPHPRGYYKCSTVRGCPARKHVEKSLEDSSMLVITYEGEHSHPQPVNEVMQE